MLTQTLRRYTPPEGFPEDTMAGQDLQVRITFTGDLATVTMAGEAHFDFDQADDYIHDVLSREPKSVIVDATGLAFISSVGMCFLINLRKAVRTAGGSFKLHGLQPMVRQAFEHARVLNLFEGDSE